MTWKFQPALERFEMARKDWDALNLSRGNHILLDSGFVALLLRHFGRQDTLLARNDSHTQSGMALLSPRGKGLWETFQPSQAPIGLILFEAPDKAGEDLRQMLQNLPGPALQLSVLQQDPDFSCIGLQRNGFCFERVDYIQTARITLSGTFEEYWKARGTNLRHNLSRRRRRMSETGCSLELAEIRTPAGVAAAIREYGRLESKGWKGREGTAVAEENAQGRFYRDAFEYFAARGEAVIYQLRLNGKVAACDLCLLRGGMMIVLKTAYDEEMREFSPAFLMREEVLRNLYAGSGVRVIEFYGRVMEWHTKWSEEIRPLYHINCLRNRWVGSLKKFFRRFG